MATVEANAFPVRKDARGVEYTSEVLPAQTLNVKGHIFHVTIEARHYTKNVYFGFEVTFPGKPDVYNYGCSLKVAKDVWAYQRALVLQNILNELIARLEESVYDAAEVKTDDKGRRYIDETVVLYENTAARVGQIKQIDLNFRTFVDFGSVRPSALIRRASDGLENTEFELLDSVKANVYRDEKAAIVEHYKAQYLQKYRLG